MAVRLPVVIGGDGLPQQLQPGDTTSSSGSNANGKWLKRADGVIEQTGTVALAAGIATITFPIPFPNSCDWVGPVAQMTSTQVVDVSVYLTGAPGLSTAGIGGSVATLGLNAAIAGANFTVRWRATGS